MAALTAIGLGALALGAVNTGHQISQANAAKKEATKSMERWSAAMQQAALEEKNRKEADLANRAAAGSRATAARNAGPSARNTILTSPLGTTGSAPAAKTLLGA